MDKVIVIGDKFCYGFFIHKNKAFLFNNKTIDFISILILKEFLCP